MNHMITWLLDFLHILTDPQRLIEFLSAFFAGGWAYLFVFLLLFSETGLLLGFFLPGDSFLFTLGVIAGAGGLKLWLLDLVLIAASVIGDSTGYGLGRYIGQRAFNRTDSFIFNKKHLDRTKTFFDKHGGKTIIFARFIPIIRTFTPFVAGASQMSYSKFLPFSIAGGIGWVVIVTFLGYQLGNIQFVRQHFDKFIIGIILVSLIPVFIEWLRSRRNKNISS
ncbi:MAG: VTT domain-containing protein [Acidobacteriaceae bacterium]